MNAYRRGFTLVELLTAALMAGIFLAGTAKIMIDILTLDKRESARENVQSELNKAMDFMSSELSEAVYVYTGEELEEKLIRYSALGDNYIPEVPASSPGDVAALPRFRGFPVIAFWKLESTHESCDTVRCPLGGDSRRIGSLRDQGYAYVLVVYYIRTNNEATIWHPEADGLARIQRFVLPPYTSTNPFRDDYIAPSVEPPGLPNFSAWPGTSGDPNPPTRSSIIIPPMDAPDSGDLVDVNGFINAPRTVPEIDADSTLICPENYEASPRRNATAEAGTALLADERVRKPASDTFYACISPNQTGQTQDVILYLQGDALDLGGLDRVSFDCSDDPTLCPKLQTRVFARGFFGKDPT